MAYVKFKPIKNKLTCERIREKIIPTLYYYISSTGMIHTSTIDSDRTLPNTSSNRAQLQKVLAINQLMNIAKYYNGDWEPDWDDTNELRYFICYDTGYCVKRCKLIRYGLPVFKFWEDAYAVVKNPNFRKILDTIFKN